MSKRVAFLTDLPLVLEEECEDCGGYGDQEGIGLCDACDGSGQVITEDGRVLIQWVAANLPRVIREELDALDEAPEVESEVDWRYVHERNRELDALLDGKRRPDDDGR